MGIDSIGYEPQMDTEQPAHSTVELNFFRHNEKDGDKLTIAGRHDAIAKGQNQDNNNIHSVSFGSPKNRAQETALLQRWGSKLDPTFVDSYTTVAELAEEINKIEDVKIGSKIGIRNQLDFQMSKGPILDAAMKAIKENRYFDWLVHESPNLIPPGDKENWSLNRQAANIASEIDRYVRISGRFDKIVEEKGVDFGNKMERFLGSHSGVLESFLIRVIEKTKGVAEAEKFAQAIPDGFGYSEGFKTKITTDNTGSKPTIHIEYSRKSDDGKSVYDFSEDVPLDVVQEIMSEGEK